MAYVGKKRVEPTAISIDDINELRDIVSRVVESETLDMDTIFDMAVAEVHGIAERRRLKRHKMARMVERIVMENTAKKIFAAGYMIKIMCDGECVHEIPMHDKITATFMSDIVCADVLEWCIYNEHRERVGTILMVLGNDGDDVIADHSDAMVRFMPSMDEANTYAAMLDID